MTIEVRGHVDSIEADIKGVAIRLQLESSRSHTSGDAQCGEFSGWFASPFADEHKYDADGKWLSSTWHGKSGAYCSLNKGHYGSHSWADDPWLPLGRKLP